MGLVSVITEWRSKGRLRKRSTVTVGKAREILRDGTARGHELTPRQKRYFGWIAGGKK